MGHDPMTEVLREEGNLDIDTKTTPREDTETQGECHVTTEVLVETRVMLQPLEASE